jgi:Skp family chaperone for outer membrane proteins
MNSSAPFLLLAALAAAPGMASAQAAAPPAANPNPMGPPIAGVCLFGRDAAIANSKAGQATDARLRQLTEQVRAEITPEGAAIVAENTAITNAGATLGGAAKQQRVDALQKRAQAFSQLQQLRNAQLEQTRNQALASIVQAMSPLLGPISTSHHCSVVIERSATYGFNQAMDLTPAVVQQLDAHLPTITFNLSPPESVKR